MLSQFQGPARYRQGPGALETAGKAFSELRGERALVVGGDTALSIADAPLRSALDEAGIEVGTVLSGIDHCSRHAVENCTRTGREEAAELVVGVGGGHALDTAKATAIELGAEAVTVPTVASTDAPCSAIAALYDHETGAFEEVVHRDRNPELVVVDTGLIADAPTDFLRYGMADAFATRFEAEAVASHPTATTVAGERPTHAGLTLARSCYDNLETHGADALAAAERDAVTPALERIVETAVLLSGLGFECGGLAAAHAYQEGFTRAGVAVPHGISVGFGTIAQLILEDRTDALESALDLYFELGIDTTLAELDVERDTVEEIAAHACADDTPMGNEPVEVTQRGAADALVVADERIRSRR